MIPLSATILIVALAISSDIILEIGSEITAATLDDPNMGAQIEPTAPPQTSLVDLSPGASVSWPQ